jgi:hypothetical protein
VIDDPHIFGLHKNADIVHVNNEIRVSLALLHANEYNEFLQNFFNNIASIQPSLKTNTLENKEKKLLAQSEGLLHNSIEMLTQNSNIQ